ncbi:MAG: type transport system permease protein [Acidimicrobiaceae bacterium]|jgi:ABC-2 type transport system permease protein|nr:type transport system permease protein [Acidimicrobiaceae bacterium]
MNATAKLFRTELRLVLREPLVLTFVFAFPIVTVLVIAGSFGTHPTPGFAGTKPSDWYVSSYLAVVIAAIGLVMVPVHVASYRERGVLRRFASAGFPRWSFAVAQVAAGVVLTVAASAVLLAVAGAVYGLPPIESPLRVVAGIILGAVAFTSVGLLLGACLPNARAAQGVGLLLFFPSFLLGGGGPPPSQMGSAMHTIAQALPLTHVTESIRNPWLGLGTGSTHLLVVAAVLAATALGWRRAVKL